MTKLYRKRDASTLEPFYSRNVLAMTTESLHRKSDIAAELAWRDAEIERLRAQINSKPMSEAHRNFLIKDGQ